jgi:hypothetical protein
MDASSSERCASLRMLTPSECRLQLGRGQSLRRPLDLPELRMPPHAAQPATSESQHALESGNTYTAMRWDQAAPVTEADDYEVMP